LNSPSPSEFRLLARLFLLELDETTRAELEHDARFAQALPCDLTDARIEFTRLLTLSVYPYTSVFLDSPPTLNSESSAQVERFYESVGFAPASDWVYGAPDALGVELACAASLLERGLDASDFLCNFLLPWAPVCCLAIERNAHLDFYRTLARVTCDALVRAAERINGGHWAKLRYSEVEPEEWDLNEVIDFLLAPARCGVFISKQELQRIAAAVQIPLSFGERGLMLMSLLRGGGLNDQLGAVLEGLEHLLSEWVEKYEWWMRAYPHSSALWQAWFDRTTATQRKLVEMSSLSANWQLEPDAGWRNPDTDPTS